MDEFTFRSNAFRSTILCLITFLLSWDIFTLARVFLGQYSLNVTSPLLYAVMAASLLIKIAIIVSALSMKGPLRSLLYLFGGVLVIGGLAHFLYVWTGGINPASIESLFKLVLICLGFVLVLPARQAIEYPYDP